MVSRTNSPGAISRKVPGTRSAGSGGSYASPASVGFATHHSPRIMISSPYRRIGRTLGGEEITYRLVANRGARRSATALEWVVRTHSARGRAIPHWLLGNEQRVGPREAGAWRDACCEHGRPFAALRGAISVPVPPARPTGANEPTGMLLPPCAACSRQATNCRGGTNSMPICGLSFVAAGTAAPDALGIVFLPPTCGTL